MEDLYNIKDETDFNVFDIVQIHIYGNERNSKYYHEDFLNTTIKGIILYIQQDYFYVLTDKNECGERNFFDKNDKIHYKKIFKINHRIPSVTILRTRMVLTEKYILHNLDKEIEVEVLKNFKEKTLVCENLITKSVQKKIYENV